MIWKKIIENPMLMIGILLFSIFYANYLRLKKVNPYSCQSAIVMLQKRAPKNWDLTCKENNLEVSINFIASNSAPAKELLEIKPKLYRSLANELVFLAKNCLEESLERTDKITVTLKHSQISLQAFSTGEKIVNLAAANKPETIASILKDSVQVKEIIK